MIKLLILSENFKWCLICTQLHNVTYTNHKYIQCTQKYCSISA